MEEAVTAHPKVAEAAVIGVPDDRWGETPLAVVVPARPADPPSAEEIEQWCRTRLAAYKCPRRVDVVAELPRNAGGKVLKTELRRLAGARAAAIPTAPGDGAGRAGR